VCVDNLHIFFGNMFPQIICPVLKQVLFLFAVELRESLLFSFYVCVSDIIFSCSLYLSC
jgi:hypothetical protein